jgi:hypothetical protein
VNFENVKNRVFAILPIFVELNRLESFRDNMKQGDLDMQKGAPVVTLEERGLINICDCVFLPSIKRKAYIAARSIFEGSCIHFVC